ncbi:MAG TPA: Tim44/TimA family putative adaptor protein [Terricaulis sp.]|nr:Tim44/TimA family putative adaptor protein [Terricaulis sp.]
MDQALIEYAVLAFVAGFVLFRLYTTLGRRVDSERPTPRPAPAQGEMPRENNGPQQMPAPMASGPAGEGLMAIVRADPQFDVEHFIVGARAAYELIISAFAKGDRDALSGLLTPRVYESYAAAISAREAKNEAGPELVRLKTGEIVDADLAGDIARITVRFEAELAEGAHGVRDARERWTFERDVRSPDPNWRLARVSAA